MMSKKELSSEFDGLSENVQNPCSGVDCKWRSAHPRGGTSVRSWLESVRNRATIQGNACSPIARQALRRPRILLWVGQRSKATIDQRREEDNLLDGSLRTSCRSRVIHQSWKRFVFYIAITKTRWEERQNKYPVELVRPASSSSSSSVLERSDVQAPRRLLQSPEIQNQNKKRDDKEKNRTTRWQIFLTVYRISKKIWQTQNCLHPHTVLGNQI